MAVQYKNRKDDTYYLQAGKTKTGKPRYWCGKKLTGEPLEAIPEGYEFREDPATAIVTLRKICFSEISPLDVKILSDAIRQHAGLEYFIVDVDGNALVVYLPDRGEDAADQLLEEFGGFHSLLSHRMQEKKAWLMRRSAYTKMMRFTLVDPAERKFIVERWCFRGSVDDWIGLGRRTALPLPELARMYVEELGKESFYDLM
jgi:hypothetical protein